MIDPGFARVLARYNAWQNEGLVAAAGGLDDASRRADRGAFFGSIAATFSHILWADRLWLHRLAGDPAPPGGLPDSPRAFPDWPAFRDARAATDRRLLDWARDLSDADLAGDLAWQSGVTGRTMARPRALIVVHLFNHQTHHRGQIHAMLTAAGAKTGMTDLAFLPDHVAEAEDP